MHRPPSVVHQSMILGTSSLRCSRLVGSTGRPGCDGLPVGISSLLAGAGESDELARPGEGQSGASLRCAGENLPLTWTLSRATAPCRQK